jgi:hypothetical protein
VLTSVTAATYLASADWLVGCFIPVGQGTVSVDIGLGLVRVLWGSAPALKYGFYVELVERERMGWKPGAVLNGPLRAVGIPLWIPLVLSAIATCALILRTRVSHRGHCPTCGTT